MNKILNHRIAIIYKFFMSLSLVLMLIATIEMFFFGGHFNLDFISYNDVIYKILKGEPSGTFFMSIAILIFSPIVNLIVIILTFFQNKNIQFIFIGFLLLIIMLSSIFLKLN